MRFIAATVVIVDLRVVDADAVDTRHERQSGYLRRNIRVGEADSHAVHPFGRVDQRCSCCRYSLHIGRIDRQVKAIDGYTEFCATVDGALAQVLRRVVYAVRSIVLVCELHPVFVVVLGVEAGTDTYSQQKR